MSRRPWTGWGNRVVEAAIRRVSGIVDDMRADLAAGRGFLWTPIGFGCGAAVYFALPSEPALGMVAVPFAAMIGAILALRLTAGRSPVLLAAATLVAAGLVAAKLEVERSFAPHLTTSRVATVTGLVVAVEDRGDRGARLLLETEAIDPPPREGVPLRVRLASRTDGDRPAPGDRIRVLARLGPPQPPLFPGGYDFARSAWFNRIGGVGFTLGRIDRLAAADPPGARLAARIAVERFRADVSDRIRTILPGDAGAIAAALIVGDRGAIDPETDEAMRISGLSHVLSISGLHMALVSACLYGGLRAALALVPFVALRLPIKQIAAAAALAGTAGYLVMAGMSLATQRSAVMIAIALLAVFVGRQPFSLRAVAVAALIVMAFSPQAVLDPGAQMSFAAVTALIAGYEALAASRQPPGPGDVNVVVRWTRGAGRWIGLSLYTSLLAGLATAPIAIHHFNRSAPLGLVANLLATPLVSVVIMPAGLVAALAMPVGLDSWPLALMGAGIDGMVAIARIVADWTPGGGTVGRPPLAGTMLVVSGGVWLCLWTRRARRPGWLLMAAGIAVSLTGERPDLVVAGDGRRALLALDGARPVLVGRADDFETGIWLAAMGDPRRPDDPSLVTRTRCDPEACILEPDERADDAADDRGSANGADGGNGGTPRSATVAVVFRPAAFADECGASDILIAAIPAPDWCRQYSVVIDARELAESGARTYRIIRDPDTAAGVRLEEIARALPRPRRPFDIGRP